MERYIFQNSTRSSKNNTNGWSNQATISVPKLWIWGPASAALSTLPLITSMNQSARISWLRNGLTQFVEQPDRLLIFKDDFWRIEDVVTNSPTWKKSITSWNTFKYLKPLKPENESSHSNDAFSSTQPLKKKHTCCIHNTSGYPSCETAHPWSIAPLEKKGKHISNPKLWVLLPEKPSKTPTFSANWKGRTSWFSSLGSSFHHQPTVTPRVSCSGIL